MEQGHQVEEDSEFTEAAVEGATEACELISIHHLTAYTRALSSPEGSTVLQGLESRVERQRD